MPHGSRALASPGRRRWPLIFPLLYAAHLTEEVTLGDGFPAWLNKHAGARLTMADFPVLNAVAMVMATAASVLAASRWPGRNVPLAALATIALINAALHLGGSIATASISPGVFTAMFCWVPFGVLALRAGWREDRPALRVGALAGTLLHALISYVALRL